MKLQPNQWLWSIVAAGCLASAASAQTPFIDNFDSYTVGSVINGQNGWKQWGSAPNTTNVIEDSTTGFARSGNSVSIQTTTSLATTSDLVHEFTGFTTGQHTLRVWHYAETGVASEYSFIVLNTYTDAGPWNWSVQVKMRPAQGMYFGDCGAQNNATGPLVMDTWVELRAQIDLSSDLVEVFYNGAPIWTPYSWTGGVFGAGGGALNIAAVDLYRPPYTAGPWIRVYHDDFSLTNGFPPGPPTTYCTAKTNSQNGFPLCPNGVLAISGTGTSSATSPVGFTIAAANSINNKIGILIYKNSISGSAMGAQPFAGGLLCLASGLGPNRTTPVNSGGTPAPVTDCTGVYSIDMNTFARGLIPGPPVPQAYLSVPGQEVVAQFWGRDPGFPPPNNVQLSDGLRWIIDL